MLIILGLIFLYIMLYIISKHKYSHDFKGYNKKENPFLPLYPLAACMAGLERILIGRRHEQSRISTFQKLYPKGNASEEYRCFVLRRNSIVIVVIFIFLMLAAVSEAVSSKKARILDGYALLRPVNGGTFKVSLQLYTEGIQGKDFLVNVRRKRLKGEELENYFEQVRDGLEAALLSQNESVDYITSSLNFIEEISDPDMHISWHPEDTLLISITGRLNNENISGEGIITYITLILTYYEEESREYTIPVHIYPPELTAEELLIQEIDKEYNKSENNSLYEEYVILPENVMQNDIIWVEKESNTLLLFIAYGLTASAAVYISLSKEIKKKEKYREKQMMLDYSNIISKLALFLAAGMTIRGAWECIVNDYEKKQKGTAGSRKKGIHYAYEEMLAALNEMKVGVSEMYAYENFGKRCRLIPYTKLASIIVQNLKKGTTGILPLLEMEKRQAFSDRKELSKRLGEEAGTKLQIPLMIYLVIVLIIVLVPAFLSL